MTGAPPNLPPLVWQRFLAKVERLDGFECPALWKSPPRDDGYGQFWVPKDAERLLGEPERANPGAIPGQGVLFAAAAAELDDGHQPVGPGRPWRAHRVAYAAWYGPIGPDDVVMHRCDRPLCTPVTRADVDRHLTLGTQQTNSEDREHKGRSAGRRAYGLLVWGRGDRRGPYGRSLALHEAMTTARAAGASTEEMTRIVRQVDGAGDPFPGQLTVPDESGLCGRVDDPDGGLEVGSGPGLAVDL